MTNKKKKIIIYGTRYMGLSSKMYDDVGCRNKGVHQFGIRDIPVPEKQSSIIVLVDINRKVFDVSCVGQGIEHYDPVVRILVIDVPHKIAPYKTGDAGN